MADEATIRTRIDEIDTILAGGVSSANIGNRSVTYDLIALRAERKSLVRQLSSSSSNFRRVVFKSG